MALKRAGGIKTDKVLIAYVTCRKPCLTRIFRNTSRELEKVEERGLKHLLSTFSKRKSLMRRSNCFAPISTGQPRGQRKNVFDKKGRGTEK